MQDSSEKAMRKHGFFYCQNSTNWYNLHIESSLILPLFFEN